MAARNITMQSKDEILVALREVGISNIDVFEPSTPRRPTEITARFEGESWKAQKEAVKAMGFHILPTTVTICVEPQEKSPSIRERYERMTDEQKKPADNAWVKAGGAIERKEKKI